MALPALSLPPFRGLVFGVILLLVLLYLSLANSYIQPTISPIAVHDAPSSLSSVSTTNLPVEESAPSSPLDTATPAIAATPRILLVSALFPVTKSKHSSSDYSAWLSRFLSQITTDTYFYTTLDLAPTVLSVINPHTRVTLNTSYASAFAVPPLRGLEDAYEAMYANDREKWRHSPALYAVWNAKPFLLAETVRMLQAKGEEYDYVFWSDAGSFRVDHAYSAWPDPARVQEVWEEGERLTGRKKEDLLFFPTYEMPGWGKRYWKEEDGPIDYDLSEGSFFGGSPQTVSWWSSTFYAYHDYYLSKGLFVGKDQTLINALFMLFPERIFTVWQNDPNPTVVPIPQLPASSQNTSSLNTTSSSSQIRHSLLPAHLPLFDLPSPGACGPNWYYYQFFLASPATQRAQQEIWLAKVRWQEWAWWRERQRCRLLRPRGMKDVLLWWFGRGWGVVRGSVVKVGS